MLGELFNRQRDFRIWHYTVGHKRLLLRSTKQPTLNTRVDVLFVGVDAINLPTALSGVSIRNATEQETQQQVFKSLPQDKKIFVVEGSQYCGYVIAADFSAHEDDKEYDEMSYWDTDPKDRVPVR